MIVEDMARVFHSIYSKKPEIIVSAPGRLDFLNTHQDYKGLPVIGVAVNLRTYIAVSRREDSKARVISLNLKEEGLRYEDSFSIDAVDILEGRWFGNYVRAGVKLLTRKSSIEGFNMMILSYIPMGSGLGSSGALLVASLGALNELYNLNLTVRDLAELAFEAEHYIMGIPCGRLDQYTSAFGGVAVINTKAPYDVERLPFKAIFAVLDSGIKHATADIHPRRQEELLKALQQLLGMNMSVELKTLISPSYYDTNWERLTRLAHLLTPYIQLLEPNLRNRILYTIYAHKSTLLALKILKKEFTSLEEIIKELEPGIPDVIKLYPLFSNIDKFMLGALMTYQHRLLSKFYDVSLPELDKLVNLSIRTGAYGAKLSGAGLGGAVIALVPSKSVGRLIIKKAVDKGLALRGWIVKLDEGLRVELR